MPSRSKPARRVPTLAELRAEIDAAKIVAAKRFEQDWGTSDVAKVGAALMRAIPESLSPADAAAKARATLYWSDKLGRHVTIPE